MRSLATAFLSVVLASFAAGCASESEVNGSTRSRSAQNPIPPVEGIGPNANVGTVPRDMPGNGRGSLPTSHGR